MKKEREKKMYFAIVISDGQTEDVPLIEWLEFSNTKELNAWLTGAGARAHHDILKAGQCYLELDDGRECRLIQGALRVIKAIAKVAVV